MLVRLFRKYVPYSPSWELSHYCLEHCGEPSIPAHLARGLAPDQTAMCCPDLQWRFWFASEGQCSCWPIVRQQAHGRSQTQCTGGALVEQSLDSDPAAPLGFDD